MLPFEAVKTTAIRFPTADSAMEILIPLLLPKALDESVKPVVIRNSSILELQLYTFGAKLIATPRSLFKPMIVA